MHPSHVVVELDVFEHVESESTPTSLTLGGGGNVWAGAGQILGNVATPPVLTTLEF